MILRRTKPVCLFLAVLALIAAMALWASPALAAKARIKSITAQADGDKLVVTVALSARLKPKVFPYGAKGKKPRVVVDFIGAAAAKLPSRIKSPSPLSPGLRIGRHPDKIRLVVDLQPGRVYRINQWFRKDVNHYILELGAQP